MGASTETEIHQERPDAGHHSIALPPPRRGLSRNEAHTATHATMRPAQHEESGVFRADPRRAATPPLPS